MRKIELLEMPSEIGAGTRGSSLGIDALRIAAWNIRNNYFKKYPSTKIPDENHMLYEEITTPNAIRIDGIVKIYERLSNQVKEVLGKGNFPLLLSADHASAGGTIAGIKMAYPEKRLGVIWVDAHGDLHSPYSSPSGNMHGMPLATALAEDNLERQINKVKPHTVEKWEELKNIGGISPKIKAEDLVFFGARDMEEPEKYFLKKNNVKNFTVKEVRKKGVNKAVIEAMEILKNCDIIYLSFDVDSMDCELVSHGTGTPVKNGFTPEEALNILKAVASSEKLVCFEMVEVNPTLDEKKNKMAETAFAILNKVTKTIEDNF